MKSLLKILKFTKNLWPYYLFVSVMSMVVSLLAQATPLLVGGIVGELQKIGGVGADNKLIWLFVAFIFAQDVLSTVLSNIQGYCGDLLGAKLQRDLSEKYYKHIMSLPQSYFDGELSGKITARLNRSVVELSEFAKVMANMFLSFAFTAVASLAIVAYISWRVALVLSVLYPIFVYLTVKTSGKWMKFQMKKNEHQDIAFGRFQEVITQVKVVKSFVREATEQSFFKKHMTAIIGQTIPQSKLWHRKDVERKMILNVVMGLVLVIIAWQATSEQISLAEAVMLIQFTALIKMPIFTVSFMVENIQKAVADSKDYFAVMDIMPSIVDKPNAKKLKVGKGLIEFRDVSFAYGKTNVINGLDFTIEPGTKVALVGESGEGKSTISNLLLRLYEPNEGSILIDGQDIASIKQTSLRKDIGVVFQDASLFSGTIAENIKYGAPKATDAQVKKAAKSANAHEFVSKLDNGYDTAIGERGLKLSGGQKQRIAIARAILKNAPILVLDEATSSLDNKSELLVHEALEHLMKGRTTIIIAHRLSTIQSVDQIVTLSGGKVNEIGSPKELAKSGGIYARLLEVQSVTNPEERKKVLAKYGISA